MFNFDEPSQPSAPFSFQFDVSNVKNDIEQARQRVDNSYFNEPSIQGERIQNVKLFLFSPKKLNPHLVRPHTYNFDDPHCLEVLNRSFINNDPMVSKQNFMSEPMLNLMVKPSSGGHLLGLDNLSDSWTFMLTVDIIYPDQYVAYGSNVIDRSISTGFCKDEPVNPITHTPNPNAILKFTHHSKFRLNRNKYGASAPLQNIDIVPVELRGIANDEHNLFPMAPSYMQPTDPILHSKREIFQEDNQVVAAMTGLPYGTALPLKAETKSTKNHLNCILSTLEEAKNAFETESVYDSDFNNYGRTTGLDLESVFYKRLSQGKNTTASGIASWDVRTLAEVDNKLHGVSIVVVNAAQGRTWEAYPSYYVNDTNTFNAWIADMVSYLCESSGIIELSFAYDSYQGNQFQKEGRWVVQKFDSIHTDKNQCLSIFKAFQLELENNIFSLLRMMKDEFSLMIHYRAFNDTLISLNFYGEEVLNGFYEHPTHLSGLITPNIGQLNYYSNNAQQMQHFVDRFSCSI